MPLTEANHNERISMTREQLKTINRLVDSDQIFDVMDTEHTGYILLVYRIPDSCDAGKWVERHTVHISPGGQVTQKKVEDL